MPICKQRLATGRTARETIAAVLCQTMPTAAAASGLVSPVDLTAAVDALWETHAEAKLTARTSGDLGLTALGDWLAGRGEVVGREVLRLFRERLIREGLRRAVVAGNAQFARVRLA